MSGDDRMDDAGEENRMDQGGKNIAADDQLKRQEPARAELPE